MSKKGKELTDMVIVVGVGVEEGVRKMVVEKYNKIINEIKQSKIKIRNLKLVEPPKLVHLISGKTTPLLWV